MKRFFLISLAIALAMGVSAQESATVISADRPGMATGVDVMPFKSVQWETGFQYDYSSGAHSITLPTTLFRLGITRFAEIRMEYDGTLASADKKQWEYAVEPLVVGTKIKVFEGTENEKLQWLPAVSFLLNLAVPSTPDLAKTTHVAPLRLPIVPPQCNRLAQHRLQHRCRVGRRICPTGDLPCALSRLRYHRQSRRVPRELQLHHRLWQATRRLCQCGLRIYLSGTSPRAVGCLCGLQLPRPRLERQRGAWRSMDD